MTAALFISTIRQSSFSMDEKKRNVHLKVRNLSETEEQMKERLRIRRENKKTENHEKQRQATIKRLKRSDYNELEET